MTEGDLRVLVLGAGSAGSRHVRNLLDLGIAVAVMDPDESRRRAVEGARWLPMDLDRTAEFDGVVVATPSSLHREHTLAALAGGARVLVEKPLATTAAGLDDLVSAAGDRLAVGYNLRFHRPVRRLRELVESGAAGEVRRVRLWFGSHLADWRPGIDYRVTYSARAELGGGILLDASHELDLLTWLFGPAWSVQHAELAHRSALETDVEDTVSATLRSESGIIAEIDLDEVSRPYRRGVEVTGAHATLRLDWSTGTLEVLVDGVVRREAADDDVAESYRTEARSFVELLAGRRPPAVTAAEGAVVVRLCDEIRQVAAS